MIGSKGNEEHHDGLQIIACHLKQFLGMPQMNELLVPVVGQPQAVMSGNRTLNLLTEFGNLVSAVAAVADITETGSVISDKMHKTMAEHIDARKADTLLCVSSMSVAYRGLLFAGTGRADVDGAKVQMKAMPPKLQGQAPNLVLLLQSMEDSVLPTVTTSVESVEEHWKQDMIVPTDKEAWKQLLGRPSVEGAYKFRDYGEDDTFTHLKKVCVLACDSDFMASLDVQKAVASFASDLSRLARKASSLSASIGGIGGQPITVDTVTETLLEPFAKMIKEMGALESDYCQSSSVF